MHRRTLKARERDFNIRLIGQVCAGTLVILLLGCLGVSQTAADTCQLIVLTPRFWRVVHDTHNQSLSARLRSSGGSRPLIKPDLYSEFRVRPWIQIA